MPPPFGPPHPPGQVLVMANDGLAKGLLGDLILLVFFFFFFFFFSKNVFVLEGVEGGGYVFKVFFQVFFFVFFRRVF